MVMHECCAKQEKEIEMAMHVYAIVEEMRRAKLKWWIQSYEFNTINRLIHNEENRSFSVSNTYI